MNIIRVPIRYLPKNLSKKDKEKQAKMLIKSRKLYKKNKFFSRDKLPSYHNKTSKHIKNAIRIYSVPNVIPNKDLSEKTGCSIGAMNEIIHKGRGAYFSSGSRPNQSAESWGLARLASSITGGKSAAVDFNIIKKGCNHNGKAFRLAQQSRKKYGKGRGSAKKTFFVIK